MGGQSVADQSERLEHHLTSPRPLPRARASTRPSVLSPKSQMVNQSAATNAFAKHGANSRRRRHTKTASTRKRNSNGARPTRRKRRSRRRNHAGNPKYPTAPGPPTRAAPKRARKVSLSKTSNYG